MMRRLRLLFVAILSIALIAMSACDNGGNNTKELGSFSLTSPADDASGVALKPTFEWEESENAVSYKLTISVNQDFSGEKLEFTEIEGTEYTLTQDLEYETQYYWKVTAIGRGEGNTKDCGEVFSLTTKDFILQGYNDLDDEGFAEIYTAQTPERGQITAALHKTPWDDMENGNSIKISGNGLENWDYMQVKGTFGQADMSAYDGIQFWIYPKTCDQRLGMILHLLNGDYPNDAMASFAITGNAPALVKIPFSAFTMREASEQEEFNKSYITGIWFTFKNASSLGVGDGFGGTYPPFEIYFDEFKGFKDSGVTEIVYEPSYKPEFEILSVDTSSADTGDLTFVWAKSGAGDEYSLKIATDNAFTNVIYNQTVSGTALIKDGIAAYTATVNVQSFQPGTTYYAKMSCGEVETEVMEFKKENMLLLNFDNLADTDALKALCTAGFTQTKDLVSLSDNNGYNNSKAIKIAENSTGSGDIYFKGLFNDFNFDCIEFYYNVPSGTANFFLRLYLGTDYGKRAYVSFSGSGIRLSGSGIIRIPFNSTYMSNGGGASAAEVDSAVTAKGLGIYVNAGSAEFYIDNIKLYASNALPEGQDKTSAADVRTIINGLEDGEYTLVVQRSYAVENHKTLFPVVSKTFTVSSGSGDLAAEDFEDVIVGGNKYIYTIYKQGVIVAMGKLEPPSA